jgi:hypothetical protein
LRVLCRKKETAAGKNKPLGMSVSLTSLSMGGKKVTLSSVPAMRGCTDAPSCQIRTRTDKPPRVGGNSVMS